MRNIGAQFIRTWKSPGPFSKLQTKLGSWKRVKLAGSKILDLALVPFVPKGRVLEKGRITIVEQLDRRFNWPVLDNIRVNPVAIDPFDNVPIVKLICGELDLSPESKDLPKQVMDKAEELVENQFSSLTNTYPESKQYLVLLTASLLSKFSNMTVAALSLETTCNSLGENQAIQLVAYLLKLNDVMNQAQEAGNLSSLGQLNSLDWPRIYSPEVSTVAIDRLFRLSHDLGNDRARSLFFRCSLVFSFEHELDRELMQYTGPSTIFSHIPILHWLKDFVSRTQQQKINFSGVEYELENIWEPPSFGIHFIYGLTVVSTSGNKKKLLLKQSSSDNYMSNVVFTKAIRLLGQDLAYLDTYHVEMFAREETNNSLWQLIEYIDPKEDLPTTPEDLRKFHQSLGANLAIEYIFQASDCHMRHYVHSAKTGTFIRIDWDHLFERNVGYPVLRQDERQYIKALEPEQRAVVIAGFKETINLARIKSEELLAIAAEHPSSQGSPIKELAARLQKPTKKILTELNLS